MDARMPVDRRATPGYTAGQSTARGGMGRTVRSQTP
jgi:hypothetical protein